MVSIKAKSEIIYLLNNRNQLKHTLNADSSTGEYQGSGCLFFFSICIPILSLLFLQRTYALCHNFYLFFLKFSSQNSWAFYTKNLKSNSPIISGSCVVWLLAFWIIDKFGVHVVWHCGWFFPQRTTVYCARQLSTFIWDAVFITYWIHLYIWANFWIFCFVKLIFCPYLYHQEVTYRGSIMC